VRSGAVLDKGNRGYTGHEHLDFGLIHMNGRVYDPRWGRFLQADPIIQSPYDLQNYNRYSYVMNNPLSFTDPTGFSSLDRFAARFTRNFALSIGDFGGAYLANRHAYNTFQNPYVRTAAGLVAGYFTFGAASAWAASAGYGTIASGAIGGAAAGFASGGIQGGNLKSALSGAVIGAVTGAIGGALADASGTGATVGSANANKVAQLVPYDDFFSASDYTPLFHLETINVTATRLPNLCGGYGYCALSSDGMSSALISFLGLGTMAAGGPTRAAPYVAAKFAMGAKAVAQITPKGIARVESHLAQFGPDPANELMLQRLKDALRTGEASTVDRAFYVHELKESAFVARGLSNAAAHDATLSWQGIAKIPGYEAQLYVREAMGASPTTFSSAAKRAAGL
jgi:RHS repeat-associated protein